MIYFGYEARTAIYDRHTSNMSTDVDDDEIKVRCNRALQYAQRANRYVKRHVRTAAYRISCPLLQTVTRTHLTTVTAN